MLANVTSCAVIGLEGASWKWKSTFPMGCPPLSWWACPTRPYRKPASASAPRCATRGVLPGQQEGDRELAPADLRKEGPAYDLPMALGVCIASGQLDQDLDGSLVVGDSRSTGRCATPTASCRWSRWPASGSEAGLRARPGCGRGGAHRRLDVYPVGSLAALVDHLAGPRRSPLHGRPALPGGRGDLPVDMADVKGRSTSSGPWKWPRPAAQRAPLRTARIGQDAALAGRAFHPPAHGHRGGPGSNQDILRQRSAGGRHAADPAPAFRSPHHTISHAGWSAAGTGRAPEKYHLPTAASSSWTSCPSSARASWRCCASRWRTRW